MGICPWMSSGLQVDGDSVDASISEGAAEYLTLDEVATRWTNHEHGHPVLWQRACEFWGGDPADLNAASDSWCAGWNEKTPLLSYQMFSASWMLHKLLSGQPSVILAHDMGLGKTAVVIATIWASVQLVEQDNLPIEERKSSNDPYFNPRTLMNADPALTNSQVRLEQGPTLIVCQHKLDMTWVENVQKFVPGQLQIVLAGRPLEETALKTFTSRGC